MILYLVTEKYHCCLWTDYTSLYPMLWLMTWNFGLAYERLLCWKWLLFFSDQKKREWLFFVISLMTCHEPWFPSDFVCMSDRMCLDHLCLFCASNDFIAPFTLSMLVSHITLEKDNTKLHWWCIDFFQINFLNLINFTNQVSQYVEALSTYKVFFFL